LSGIGISELALLFVIGLLILGPERLPRVASQIGRWVGRARRTANQLRFQLEREIALADIEKPSAPKKKDSAKPSADQAAPAADESSADPIDSTKDHTDAGASDEDDSDNDVKQA
jgi:sec-independent protein translocase protein TatB